MVEDVGAGPLQDHPFMVANVETTWGDNKIYIVIYFRHVLFLKNKSCIKFLIKAQVYKES